jgi:hypothetical protein
MFESSPRWEQINPSAFLHEQEGLRELASYLPDIDPYHVWANIEFVGTDGFHQRGRRAGAYAERPVCA